MTKASDLIDPVSGDVWIIKTAAYTAKVRDNIITDTSAVGAFTVTLPTTPATGSRIRVFDNGNAGAAALTVDPNGGTIDGVTGNLVFDVGYTQATLVYNGSIWELALSVPSTGYTQADIAGFGSGKKSLWIPITEMFEAGTQKPGAELSIGSAVANASFRARPFNPSSVEQMHYTWRIPQSMDVTVGLSFVAYWSPNSTDTGDVHWEMRGVSLADGEALAASHVSAGCFVLDTSLGVIDDLQISAESNVKLFGTPVKGELFQLRCQRFATGGGDTFTGDAHLIGFEVFYTTEAETDD